MEHFLKIIALLLHWYINPNEKSNKYKSSHLSWLTKALIEHVLQGNVPIRYLINAKPLLHRWLISWRRSTFNEVNDWSLRHCPCNMVNFVGGIFSKTSPQVPPGPKTAMWLFTNPTWFISLISKWTPPCLILVQV